ncbi:CaiB/BaiF CoA-transferase family protein [Saccharopolyspora gloriosae]|uniref:Crotonobetainyl-CoA:carnitine CoA-transferase CaiB-like acyl-CoA transferase n=1 Tax=Saccharopolyspora gloriosae TaxID=455344 RepID=A0A840NQF9_9PSEU|nr:CaiB/BaiF CoA-transferase family protein [Saccharopolyspora gloriosae]MBB5070477.1 crotonobetainyl-CoA:carnitine CoA-transferase CaiB-like acyl-CoA transferase [Saccharopolyspora gloriosae]
MSAPQDVATGRLPLEGVRVVEFSHMIMGPSCGLVLADSGADVIKVEPVGDGDKTRVLPGSGAGFFPMFNRNKRSVAVDLKSEEGLEYVKRLIATADVVTENFRSGGLDALGLGYEELSAENPGLIYCSLKGFLSGPYEHRAALDEVVQMMGGLAYMTGPDGRPLRAGASVNDIMGGMFAAMGVMAALYERRTTGHGQLVRSSLFENNVFLVGQHMAQYAVTGRAADPMPSRLSAWAVYDVFDTGDDEKVFIGVVSDTQWRAFCAAFGLPHLAEDPTLATNTQRVGARERIMPTLRDTIRSRTQDETVRLCETARLPFAPIKRPQDLFDDPHLNETGALTEVTLADGRTARLPALPLEMGGRRLPLRLDLPRAGEHTGELARELGYSPEQISAAAQARTFCGDSAEQSASIH